MKMSEELFKRSPETDSIAPSLPVASKGCANAEDVVPKTNRDAKPSNPKVLLRIKIVFTFTPKKIMPQIDNKLYSVGSNIFAHSTFNTKILNITQPLDGKC